MIAMFDTGVRLIAMGAIGLLLCVLLMARMRAGLRLPMAGLLIGSVGYLINSSSSMEPGGIAGTLVDLLGISTPFFTWLFARRLFERDVPARWLWGIVAIIVAAWAVANFMPSIWMLGFYVIHIVMLTLIADLVWASWSGRGDDLVEKRRLIRLWLPLLIAAQAGGILVAELLLGPKIEIPWVQLSAGVSILALTLFAGIALLQGEPELLLETEEAGPKPAETPAPDALSPAEQVLQGKLEAAMAQGYYRTPGLSIAGLAAHLNVPEHRLRALINRRLGYRNFSAFLNRHRIAEAKEALADPQRVDLPVLTIAMDLGYNALPTFNRAFRSETRQTPTDYRKAAFAGANADQN